jgi:hypothetical protein
LQRFILTDWGFFRFAASKKPAMLCRDGLMQQKF